GCWEGGISLQLACFSNAPELQPLLFVIFFLIYLLIVTGNTTICATVAADPHLQTPMYWLLSNFSFLEMSYSSVILPKLLTMLVTQHKTISTTGCKFQLFFFTVFTCIEFFLLTVMAYDRYVAVCHPLHYHSLMTLRHCAKYIAAVWTFGFLDPIPLNAIIAKFSFCSSNQIDHFYCDVTPVLKLTCRALVVFSFFLPILTSYIFIISAILKIQSSEGRQKAFSTCASHLSCVIIFYGTLVFLYVRPTTSYYSKRDKFFALLHIVLIPMLNPLIYTLKNKEFQSAFIKLRDRQI
uniref:Olfactory receptor n=1 Tax=Xenopus tropicalis TaxID=8364 RepID=A0A803JQQ5_XENTR